MKNKMYTVIMFGIVASFMGGSAFCENSSTEIQRAGNPSEIVLGFYLSLYGSDYARAQAHLTAEALRKYSDDASLKKLEDELEMISPVTLFGRGKYTNINFFDHNTKSELVSVSSDTQSIYRLTLHHRQTEQPMMIFYVACMASETLQVAYNPSCRISQILTPHEDEQNVKQFLTAEGFYKMIGHLNHELHHPTSAMRGFEDTIQPTILFMEKNLIAFNSSNDELELRDQINQLKIDIILGNLVPIEDLSAWNITRETLGDLFDALNSIHTLTLLSAHNIIVANNSERDAKIQELKFSALSSMIAAKQLKATGDPLYDQIKNRHNELIHLISTNYIKIDGWISDSFSSLEWMGDYSL